MLTYTITISDDGKRWLLTTPRPNGQYGQKGVNSGTSTDSFNALDQVKEEIRKDIVRNIGWVV